MLIRNEEKFSNRNKSTRNFFEMKILRPSIIAMMIQARAALAFHNYTNTNEYLDLSTFCFTTQISDTTIVIDSHEWKTEEDSSRIYLENDVDMKFMI